MQPAMKLSKQTRAVGVNEAHATMMVRLAING
jgi:hypothetical protein